MWVLIICFVVHFVQRLHEDLIFYALNFFFPNAIDIDAVVTIIEVIIIVIKIQIATKNKKIYSLKKSRQVQ